MNNDYTSPVSDLLSIGRPNDEEWLDYVGDYGITTAHIADLQRLFRDDQFEQPEYDDKPDGYGFIHALRALGQLRDESLLVYFVETLETTVSNDWVWTDIPVIFSMLGPVAIPLIRDGLERNKQRSAIGATFGDSLYKIALAYPETRDECVASLMEQLERAEENDVALNGYIVTILTVDLKAKEALPVIEKAFEGNYVDTMIMGDWYDVQVAFGLKEPRPKKSLLSPIWHVPDQKNISQAERKEKAKKKAKRKKAKKQRKQNRKRRK